MTSEYKKTLNENIIQRVSDGAFIPFDPMNQDYLEYLAWIDLGGVPDEFDVNENASILSKISEIEAAYLLPRPLRDMILKDETNPAYAKTKEIDDKIAELREQLVEE